MIIHEVKIYAVSNWNNPLHPFKGKAFVKTLHGEMTAMKNGLITKSPLQQEAETFYAGGFAPRDNYIENTGWIYKGQLTYGLSFYEAEKMDDLPNYYHPYSIC